MVALPTIRAGVPPSHYQAYLNSPGWRVVRNRALKRANWQCSKCPGRRDLEVHHRTYERLGTERDSDVEVLCSTCHRGDHLQNPDQTSLGVYLKVASWALVKEPFASISDLADAMKVLCLQHKIPVLPARVNAALAVVCGNRLQSAPPPSIAPAGTTAAPAVSTGEAREILIRLRAKFGEPLRVRQVPSAAASTIDIYGPVPEPNWGEHDRY